MAGVRLKIGKHEVVYMPAGELVDVQEEIGNFNELDDRSLVDHSRMRRFLIRIRPNWPLAVFYLHWSDGTDLTLLDMRVRSGEATEGDFFNALVGEAHGMGCMECKVSHRVVTWAVAMGVFSDDSRRARSHSYVDRCPACNSKWDARVLEMISAK